MPVNMAESSAVEKTSRTHTVASKKEQKVAMSLLSLQALQEDDGPTHQEISMLAQVST